jgi:hypothetical protein
VATLIVAAYPASASADTLAGPDTPTVPAAQQESPQPSSKTVTDVTAPEETQANDTTDVTSTTPSSTNKTTSATLDDASTATINNDTTSAAQSGDATVANNTTTGNATSGSSTVTDTTVNSLQSNSNFTGGGNVTTFTSNVDGNQVGDLLLDPILFTELQITNTQTPPSSLTVHSKVNGQINNTIDLDAQSGNASVANNGAAGDATTGDANAVANIVNVVHSFIGADHTFVGTINIKGNLDGDILLPGTTLATLLASQSAGSNLGLTTSNQQTVNNNVVATATSGEAIVANNGQAGNATTGSASTNVTILNLTGQQVVAKNSLVVFVNVLGRWVGLIVDAPTGATSAALGDGITSQSGPSVDATVDSATTTTINNNVTVTAASGHATVANNSTAGNATTGNASASANILNLTDDNLSLGGWFGILFINVFGTWHGSFGVDTTAGTLPGDPTTPLNNPPADAATNLSNAITQDDVLAAQTGANKEDTSIDASGASNDSTNHKDVLGAAITQGQAPTVHKAGATWQFAAAGLCFSLLLLVAERALGRRKAARAVS